MSALGALHGILGLSAMGVSGMSLGYSLTWLPTAMTWLPTASAFIQKYKLYFLAVGPVIAVVLSLVATLANSVAIATLFVVAAMDSYDTLLTGRGDMYTRKLSFWVLAFFWGMLTQVPYLGPFLRLFSTFVLGLCLVAGAEVLWMIQAPIHLSIVQAALHRQQPVQANAYPDRRPDNEAYGQAGAQPARPQHRQQLVDRDHSAEHFGEQEGQARTFETLPSVGTWYRPLIPSAGWQQVGRYHGAESISEQQGPARTFETLLSVGTWYSDTSF